MKISVITICYNDKAGLQKTMNSVFTQTWPDIEYVLVDGGSTDGSKDLILQNEKRINKWVSEKDKGIYNAQNKGWKMATGKFCLFLNSGDVLVDEKVIQDAVGRLDDQTDILYGDCQLSDVRGVYGTKRHPAKMNTLFLLRDVVAHQSQFINRKLLENLNGYDESYKVVADYAFFAKAFWKYHINSRYFHRVVSVFDTTGLSSSSDQVLRIQEERKRVRKEYAPHFYFLLYQFWAGMNKMIGR